MCITVTGAFTTFSNTEETDKMPEVWHTINYSSDNNTVGIAYVLAADPMTAIRKMSHKELEDVKANHSNKPLSN